MKKASEAGLLEAACEGLGIPPPVAEYRFTPDRRWRFDFAWLESKIALEVDGGVWTQGRHTRGKGAIGDMAKLNRAAILGWYVLRCTPEQFESGAALVEVAECMKARMT